MSEDEESEDQQQEEKGLVQDCVPQKNAAVAKACRSLLSTGPNINDTKYMAEMDPRKVVPILADLLHEILACAIMLPMAYGNMRLPVPTKLWATDSTVRGVGSCCALVSCRLLPLVAAGWCLRGT